MRQLTMIGCLLLVVAATAVTAQEPEWNPASIRDCDRAGLVGIIDGYMNAMFTRDPNAVPPLARMYRMTENTAPIEVGEGVLWRSRTEATTFRIYVADPVNQQVALQTRLRVQGRDTLAAIRLKVDQRQKIEEILTEDVPANQRVPRYMMIHHVEVFPFFTLPYGMGNGWTPGSGR